MIENYILGVMIFSLLLNIITKNKIYNLSCGIWLYHGAANKPGFNWAKFDILGIQNDPRGGDACGRFSGNTIEHTNDKKSKEYKDYIKLYYPPVLEKKTNTIIGHVRKSSFYHGANNALEYTQPLVKWDEELNLITNVCVHNGTIYNTKELLDKYEVSKNFRYRYYNEKTNSFYYDDYERNDSLILAEVLARNEGYDILRDYQGTASLAWYDKITDRLYLYAGKSKNSKFGASIEERPLFMKQSGNHVWVSSIEQPLNWIRDKKDFGVEEVPKNTVMVFQSGILIEQIDIDRTKSSQSNYFTANDFKIVTPHNNSFYNNNWEDDSYAYSSYDEYPREGNKVKYKGHAVIYKGHDQCPECHGTGENFIINAKCNLCGGTGQFPKKESNKVLSLPFKKSETQLMKTIEFTEAEKQKLGKLLTEPVGKEQEYLIRYARLRYWYKGKLAHGEYHLSEVGMVHDKPIVDSKNKYRNTKPYWFLKGILIQTGDLENDRLIFHRYNRKVKEKDKDLPQDTLEKIIHYTPYPISSLSFQFILHVDQNDSSTWNAFKGQIYALFSRYYYIIDNGELISSKLSPSGLNVSKHMIKKQEIIDTDKVNDQLVDEPLIITDTEEVNNAYDEMIQKRVAEDLSGVLLAVTEAMGTISEVSDHKYGMKAFEFLHEFKEKIINVEDTLKDGLPF